jgi:hypothetical protein
LDCASPLALFLPHFGALREILRALYGLVPNQFFDRRDGQRAGGFAEFQFHLPRSGG